MSKNASSQKGFSRFKGKVKMVIMDTILCGKGVLLAVVITVLIEFFLLGCWCTTIYLTPDIKNLKIVVTQKAPKLR